MDATLEQHIRDVMTREAERAHTPEDYPRLPDLPVARYTSRSLFELERERVFGGTWLLVGHATDLPGPGSFYRIDLPMAPLVLVRDQNDRIRAFRNICRHRGAGLVREQQGSCRKFVCPFHSWSYDLDGSLRGVTEKQDFEKVDLADRDLSAVRCEQWGGFIFVNLDPDAGPLLEAIAPFVRRFSIFADAPLRIVRRRTYDVECNWKLAIEAFLESYHFKTVHPQTVAKMLRSDDAAIMLHPDGHSSMYMSYRDLSDDTDADMMQYRMDDIPPIKGLSSWYTEANASSLIFPNLIFNVEETGFPLLQFWPISPDTTRYDEYWLGVDWGAADRPPSWDIRLAGWDFTVGEDLDNFAAMQRSMRAAVHTGIPLSYQERRIWHFHAEMDRIIGPEQVPESVRVADLLSGYLEP